MRGIQLRNLKSERLLLSSGFPLAEKGLLRAHSDMTMRSAHMSTVRHRGWRLTGTATHIWVCVHFPRKGP